jgi:hypothetical protein
MRIIVGCEKSQIITKAFRNVGIEAFSCDILTTDGNPDWHFQEDVLEVLKREKFDLGIFHPPCTYLSYVGNRHWNNPQRKELREQAMDFFMKLYNAPIPKICVENPVGYPNTIFRKPDQIIHPYYFGDPELKRTCLWLKNLPNLDYSKTIIDKPEPKYISNGIKTKGKKIYFTEKVPEGKNSNKIRSVTFPGIAKAIVEQWR